MKNFLVVGLVALGAMVRAQTLTGDLIVRPKQDEMVASGPAIMDRQSALRLLGDGVRKHIEGPDLYVVHPPQGESLSQFKSRLERSGQFDLVTTDKVLEPAATPDDPFFNNQWHLTQISAPRAWDFVRGLNAPILAVVDAGCDITHPDLAPQMVPGYNVMSGLAQTAGGDVSDVSTSGHGTRCMSIAVAKGNDGVGISGVGWALRGMPVRVTNNTNGTAVLSNILAGVTWAVNNGAKVVSSSFSGISDPSIETTGAWCRTQGALLVWAAGNDNTDLSSFDWRNVTIVGGTDQNDAKIGVSNFGRAVDIYAPAIQIYTARKGGTWGNAPAGTSFATPQVAAAMALMMQRNPTLSPDQIEMRVFRRGRDLGDLGNDLYWGWGRLNVGTSVEWPTRSYDLVELPRDSSWIQAWAVANNNVGDVIGYAVTFSNQWRMVHWRNGAIINQVPLVGFYFPVSTWLDTSINNNGQVAGGAGDGYNYCGFEYSLSTGLNIVLPDPAWNRTRLMGINDSGVIAGVDNTFSDLYGGFTKQFGIPQKTFIDPASQVCNVNAINNSGQIAGVYYSANTSYTPPFVYKNGTFTFLQTTLSPGNYKVPTAITNSGLVVGLLGTAFNNAFPAIWRTSLTTQDFLIPNPQGGTYGYDSQINRVNEAEEMVGKRVVNGSNLLYIFDGLRVGALDSMLTSTLPAGIVGLNEAFDINDKGEIVGRATDTLGRFRPILLRPNDNPSANVSLGQIQEPGQPPVYVGSIPPALSITFTDSNGAPIPGANANLSYTAATGRMALNVPPAVTGIYRMYLRASRYSIPGFNGPRYLSRLYPPIGTPALPRDTSYIPQSGIEPVAGQAVLEMYPGDVDGSNEIDAIDIDLVIAAFGVVDGDPTWNPDADCDGSGEIDAIDIDIVIANFGLTGDPEP